LLNPALRCDFDDQSAGEFNGFQPTSLRNGTGNSKRASGNLGWGTGNFNGKTGRALWTSNDGSISPFSMHSHVAHIRRQGFNAASATRCCRQVRRGLRIANSNPHAFLLFESSHTAQGFGGTGLDFAITRKLARIIRLAIDRSLGEIRCAR
jgi:hypothetical protein